MPKAIAEIRSLARSHTKTAVNVLVGVMRSKDATHAARVSAANAILDRGWGKAPQALGSANDGALELIHRIERVMDYNADSINVASANNFIRAGYRLYEPQSPWGWPRTLYWRKSIVARRAVGSQLLR
jgi:hypothetical protein